jgi:hypothetical protein
MKETTNTADPARTRRKPPAAPIPASSSPAKRQAAAILEVLAGVLRPAEAAQLLGTSLPRYYLWEKRALVGLLAACEPAPRGPRLDAARQLAALERENRRLRRECDRQQALVRAAERALGLPRVNLTKPSAKPKEGTAGSHGKRRRVRRPTVRALRASEALRREALSEESSSVPEATATSSPSLCTARRSAPNGSSPPTPN